MVGSSGLEPPTSRLSGVRSNHLSYEPIFSGYRQSSTDNVLPLPIFNCLSRQSTPLGGDERDRTADPLLAKQVLSQLSYTPALCQQTLYNRQLLSPKAIPTAYCPLSIDPEGLHLQNRTTFAPKLFPLPDQNQSLKAISP